MYQKYAETQRLAFEVMEASYNGVGGIKEVVAMVSGQSVYSNSNMNQEHTVYNVCL